MSEGSPRQIRRLLSLDGGGILGIISLQILKRLENDLRQKTHKGDEFRLGHYFDFIAGNSTGSIIATGLCLGMSVDELISFYYKSGKEMFSKNSLLKRFRASYKKEPLENLLREVTQNKRMGSNDLCSLLMVVLQNSSTNSTWLLNNNPLSKYNDTNHPFCNLNIPLWQVVRASTAAPTFFTPQPIFVNNQRPTTPFYFVDGGVTPHNNPSIALYRTVSFFSKELGWNENERDLLLVSIGTGDVPRGDETITERGRSLFQNAKKIPTEMIATLSKEQDLNCRFLGRCIFGSPIDRELGDMIPRDDDHRKLPYTDDTGKKFSYMRFNPDLSKEGLHDLNLFHITPSIFNRMDSVKYIDEMSEVGKAYADKFVDTELFNNFSEF